MNTTRRWQTAAATLARSLVRVGARLCGALITWQRRAHDRALLREIDARALRDVGLERADVLIEARKPFWRA